MRQFTIEVARRPLTCVVAEPSHRAPADNPALLLNFSMDATQALTTDPYDLPVRAMLDAGHRAMSFDLPNHGSRVAPWKSQGIAGMREALIGGHDPFAAFVADGMAAIDEAIARGLARPGRIVAHGTSRGGYCALRLAAADRRVTAVAVIAPVTDWRALREFAEVRDRDDVAALAMERFAHGLIGRPVFVPIGNRDDRVGTWCCQRFMAALAELESKAGIARSASQLHVVPADGHGLPDDWRRAGARFLVEYVSGGSESGGP